MKVLVEGIEYEFEIEGDYAVLVSKTGDIKCPFCGSVMAPHQIGIMKKVLDGTALDISFKCSTGHYYAIFGVPMQDVKDFKPEFQTKYVVSDEVKDRLESWGYW